MVSVVGRFRPWVLLGVSFVLAAALGCGNTYRPIVTSIPPVQPAPQPEEEAVVISCGTDQANTTATSIYQACNSPSSVGLGSIVDFSGDSLLVRVNLGNGPRWVALNGSGTDAYTANADGTINEFSISTLTETNQIQTSTLLPDALPNTLLSESGGFLYVTETGRNSIAVMSGFPASVRLEIPVTATPVNLVGNYQTQRIYAISQGPGATQQSCTSAAGNGSITAIEMATNTISAVIPAGVCPIYGVMSEDNRRTFILNKNSGTVTVIDSQQNQLDRTITLPPGPNGLTPQPVWADTYSVGSILAVASAQSNTLTLINISLDSFGNDSPSFGQIIATVQVGANPTSVAILQGDLEPPRAYVANHDDGTVSSVSLTSNTVLATIPVSGHPISIAATTGTPTGKVYVVSPDSNILTIIRTDEDTISNSLVLTGTGIQVRVTSE